MNNLPTKITENDIHYTLHGDYYFPNITVPESDRKPIGRYGRMQLRFLQEHRSSLYSQLLLSGKLYEHLAEINEACVRRLEKMISLMATREGIDEAIKARDQMAWVAGMNSIRQRAEEMVLTELVYC